MEENIINEQEAVNQLYQHAANLLVEQDKSPKEVIDLLIKDGIDREIAVIIVGNLEKQISKSKKSGANRDMLFGVLWCVGGIIGTTANIGYIFWGAIVFGAIQFFRGVANAS